MNMLLFNNDGHVETIVIDPYITTDNWNGSSHIPHISSSHNRRRRLEHSHGILECIIIMAHSPTTSTTPTMHDQCEHASLTCTLLLFRTHTRTHISSSLLSSLLSSLS